LMSTNLKKYGFRDWLEIETDHAHNEELFRLKLPKRKDRGVYVIKASRAIVRIKAESDIIYIGQGEIKKRIRALVKSFLPVGYGLCGKHTAREGFERVMKELNLKLALCYRIIENPREEERQLLRAYCNDHIEPPPLNHTRR